jgi:rod shape-determining protein MreC
LGLVVLLTLVILNLPSKTTARMKLGIGSAFAPLFGLANSTEQLAGRAGDAILPRSELLGQIEALRRQNEELRLQAMRTDELARENAQLRKLFAWQQKQPRKYKLAKVVLHDPANWWRTIHIDLGSRDNIRTNMPVLSTDGLVGRVFSVSLTRSQVVLLGDPNCKVAARVENQTHDTGVVGPGSPLDYELVEMSYISGSANLKPGQNVQTSGIGGIFPKDILIGKIVDSQPGEYGFNTIARVKLAANLSALEEVWVLME